MLRRSGTARGGQFCSLDASSDTPSWIASGAPPAVLRLAITRIEKGFTVASDNAYSVAIPPVETLTRATATA